MQRRGTFFKRHWKLKGTTIYYQNFSDLESGKDRQFAIKIFQTLNLSLPCCLLHVVGTSINANIWDFWSLKVSANEKNFSQVLLKNV